MHFFILCGILLRKEGIALDTKLLTPYEVAEYLRVDYRTVYHLLHSGKLQGVKVGRVWRIPESELTRFLGGDSDGQEEK